MSKRIKRRVRRKGRKRLSKTDLYSIAKEHEISGRSRMDRSELLEATRAVRKFKRRSLKLGHKRIIVVRYNIAYEVTAKPRKQTERGKKQDTRTKAKTLIDDQDIGNFGWLGDTQADIIEYDLSHYDQLSEREQRLVDKIMNEYIQAGKKTAKRERKQKGLRISKTAKRIARKQKITVIEAQQMMNDLEDQGLDPELIDEITDEMDLSDWEEAYVGYQRYQKQKGEESLVFYY